MYHIAYYDCRRRTKHMQVILIMTIPTMML